MANQYKDALLSGDYKLAIWGAGYLGYSELANFVMSGICCAISDYSEERLSRIQSDYQPYDFIHRYFNHVPTNLDISEKIDVRKSYQELITQDALVHILCVPTQEESSPSTKWMMEALHHFVKIKNISLQISPLLIIESSLVPGTMDRLILPFLKEHGLIPGENILIGICSRTDWFDEEGKSFDSPRVVSSVTGEDISCISEIMTMTGARIIQTANYRVAELVKSIENSYRQMDTAMANQLALAFPDVDIRETLRLVSMRCNLSCGSPNFGTGGYDLPSASQYVMEGAAVPEYLSLFREANYADLAMPKMIADLVIRKNYKKIGVLGLSYRSNLKIVAMSPSIRIIEHLKNSRLDVYCYDPYYTHEEIFSIVSVASFPFPDGLSWFDAVLVAAGHRIFGMISWDILKTKLNSCELVLDNMGIWANRPWSETNTAYRMVGTPGWND